MNMHGYGKTVLVTVILAVLFFTFIHFAFTPTGRAQWNNWRHDIQTVDDATNYDTLKRVEDTCRAMIASYESDRLTYEQYKDSDNEEQRSWADQAKMRANKTAIEYNNYIILNNYVWKNNVPRDIYMKLEIIE